MKKWIIIIVVIIAALTVALLLPDGQEASDQNNQMTEIPAKTALLKTSMGDIELEFYPKDAPKAVENFLTLAERGYYNGVIFHRVVKDFMIQGGDPTGTGRGGESMHGGDFEDELNLETESYRAGYQKGVLAMANRGPNTNSSQFFIMLKDNPLPHLYSIFGKVSSGQEVVDQIGLVPVDADDRPVTPVIINEVIIR